LTGDIERYPYSLKSALGNNRFENILDSNIFSAYLSPDLPIPQIEDPRKIQSNPPLIQRHPGYVPSSQINQVFNYIGFIKRLRHREYRAYLPILYRELKKFLIVIQDIVYSGYISITEDIYEEQKKGIENFLSYYNIRESSRVKWIEKIWKQQKYYIENIDMLIETLKISGQVFNYRGDPLYDTILQFLEDRFHWKTSDPTTITDIHFVANCIAKAVKDNEPKTIWSGDKDITKILEALYDNVELKIKLPQLIQRGNYNPFNYAQLFP